MKRTNLDTIDLMQMIERRDRVKGEDNTERQLTRDQAMKRAHGGRASLVRGDSSTSWMTRR